MANRKRKRKMLSVYRLGSVAFLLIIAVAGFALSPVLIIALVAVACLIQVILDVVIAPPVTT